MAEDLSTVEGGSHFYEQLHARTKPGAHLETQDNMGNSEQAVEDDLKMPKEAGDE